VVTKFGEKIEQSFSYVSRVQFVNSRGSIKYASFRDSPFFERLVGIKRNSFFAVGGFAFALELHWDRDRSRLMDRRTESVCFAVVGLGMVCSGWAGDSLLWLDWGWWVGF
jgi:hypothetical protein